MNLTPRDATTVLLTFQRSKHASQRYSTNNGVILLVWAAVFVLNMAVFDIGRLFDSYSFGPLAITIINGILLAWRVSYVRTLPVRPLRSLTNHAIFLWSWYVTLLLLVGLVGWGFAFPHFPPCWFTILGILGALPLAIAGIRLRRLARS